MITDALVNAGLALFSYFVALLPAAGSHSWLTNADSSVVATAFAYDSIAPLHELLAVLAIMITLSVPMFGLRIAYFIYRHIPVVGH